MADSSKQNLVLDIESVETTSQVTLTDPKTAPVLDPTDNIVISTKVEIPIDTYNIKVNSFTPVTCNIAPPLPNGLTYTYNSETKTFTLEGIPHSVTPTTDYTISITNDTGTTDVSLSITIEDDVIANVGGILSTTKTVYSNVLDTCASLNISMPIINGTYLNDKYNIPSLGDISKVKLSHFSLGLQYDDLLIGDSLSINNVKHNPDDADVFRPVPLLIREKVTGLTEAERNAYSLIIEEIINGVQYISCYAKQISVNGSTSLYRVDKANNDIKINNLISIRRDRLRPVPTQGADMFSTTSKYIGHSQIIAINLTKGEVAEVKKAIDIKYSSIDISKRYNIREIGLIQSCDGTDDISHAQMAYFVGINATLDAFDTVSEIGLDRKIDIGGMMPSIVNY